MPVTPPPKVNGESPLIMIQLVGQIPDYYGAYCHFMKMYNIGSSLVLPANVQAWRYPTEGEKIIYERQKLMK